jgi:hypothetical protein
MVQYLRAQDRPNPDRVSAVGGSLDVSPFFGTWWNTNRATRGIPKVVLSGKDGRLMVRAFGADEDAAVDWGEVKADVIYADSLHAREGMAFTARYDFGFMETHLGGNLNQGLLVIGIYNTFKDDSKRADYFNREFYYR